MKKSRFASLIVVLALIGTAAFTFQAIGSAPINQAGSSPDSGAADNLISVAQNSNPNIQSWSSGLPDPSSGELLISALNLGNCFSANYTAASDCDRLASAGAPQSPTGINVHGPTLQSCFSAVYHAGSDCDRLASRRDYIGNPGLDVRGPTKQDCFSEFYRAASDCDRLATSTE